MYRVYFDGIEQNEKDIININDVAEFSIIREDGFNSTEQIIREKTEMELQFCGASYSYICEKINTDRCAEVEFRIEDDESGLSYDGTIPVTLVELDLGRRIGKTKIKDTSFSAFIRDYMDVDVYLGVTRTIGCQPLELSRKDFIFNKVHNANISTDEVIIYGFDVLDVLNQLVSYFTNNEMLVVSNYLTSNKYAITTGFNMHNFAFSSTELYPEITIQGLFAELRKKFNLYMGVEYDVASKPYIRIEQQSYFFSNTIPLFTIDEIPNSTQQIYDIKRDFNLINIGSNVFETQDPTNEFYNENRQDGWIESKYTSCGTCTGEKSSALNLVSEYIISSNIIYEALNAGVSDYVNDDSIFLFNYEVSGISNIAKRDLIDSEYVYNTSIINSAVLENFINYYSNCIALSRYPTNGFLIEKRNSIIDGIFPTPLVFDAKVYDDNIVTDYYSGSPNWLLPPNIIFAIDSSNNQQFNYFKSPITADYNLRATVNKLYRTNAFNSGITNVQLQIITYTDDTFSTYIDVFEKTVTSADGLGTPISIELETGILTLNTGQCALVVLSIKQGNSPFLGEFQSILVNFEMLTDGGCVSINENNQDSKPFIVSLDYPLCYNDYLLAKENKQGYVMLADKRFWIKELNYKHNRLSNLKLMGNYPVCGC